MSRNDNSTNSSIKWRRILWSTLILLPGLALFLSAGNWQLNRAAEKQQRLDSFENADRTPLTELPASMEAAEDLLFRRFAVTGHYESERQILLDNMVSDGEVGFQVLTPLRINKNTWLLVNRGWVKGERNRASLPVVKVDTETRKVTGRLAFLPAPGIRLDQPAESSSGESWPRRMTWPTTQDIHAALELRESETLLEWQLLLDKEQDDGFRRNWQPEAMGPERHLGYAVQWFSFAALALIIYILFHVRWTRKN